MCKYCDNQKEEEIKSPSCPSLSISIDSNNKNLLVNYGAYSCDSSIYDEKIPIKYCPFCGKKL